MKVWNHGILQTILYRFAHFLYLSVLIIFKHFQIVHRKPLYSDTQLYTIVLESNSSAPDFVMTGPPLISGADVITSTLLLFPQPNPCCTFKLQAAAGYSQDL